jgi:hypothetical protein
MDPSPASPACEGFRDNPAIEYDVSFDGALGAWLYVDGDLHGVVSDVDGTGSGQLPWPTDGDGNLQDSVTSSCTTVPLTG